jgi:hypothetical protein
VFLKRYGIKLPIYPVKGYSLTIPITDASRAPVGPKPDPSIPGDPAVVREVPQWSWHYPLTCQSSRSLLRPRYP